MPNHNLVGNLSAILAASLFGTAVVATRVVVQEFPPLSLAVLRFGQGGLILFLCLFFGARDLLNIKRRDIPMLVLLGAIFFTVFPMTFNVGIRYTEASRGALMIATMPIWSLWLGLVAGNERLPLRQVIGILITFVGVGIVLTPRGLHWQGSPMALVGDGLMLLTAFCGALYGVLAKRLLSRYSAITVTTYAMVFGTLLLFPAALVEGIPQSSLQIDGNIIILIVFLGVFCGALGFYLWTLALSRLSPTQVAVYANANPAVAIILAVLLLGENLSVAFLVGLGVLIMGVVCVNWPQKDNN